MSEINETNETNIVDSAVQQAPDTETTTATKKGKKAHTGNFIFDTALEIESLTKTKALHEADRLSKANDENDFRLGGVLKMINDSTWFDGYESFAAYVFEKFGFQERKARYLIGNYESLVTKQIPWEKVEGLGWTKLKELASILTLENVDEWVEKAKALTVAQLQAVLKAPAAATEAPSGKTTDEIVKMKFSLKADQADIVNQALAKAKGELHTDHDTVALENIAAAFVGNQITLGGEQAPASDFDSIAKFMGALAVIERIGELFPEYEITVGMVGDEATEEVAG